MSLYVNANLYLLLEITELLLFYFGILKLKYHRKKWIGPMILVSIFGVLNICLWLSGDTYLDTVITPTCILTVFMISDLKVSKRFLYFYIAELLLSIFNQVPVFFVMLNQGIEYYDWKQNGFWGLLCSSTFLLLEIIIILKMRKHKDLNWQSFFGKYQLIVFLVGLHCSVIVMVANQAMIVQKEMRTTSKIIFGFSIFLVVLIFMLVSVWLGIQQYRNQFMELQHKHMSEVISLQEQQYKMLVESDEHMRRFRHDMRAHFTVIRELSVKNKMEDVKAYINQIYETSLANDKMIYTGCVGVDAVINDLKQDIISNNVEFSFHGKMMIRDDIREYDLCTLFYNGLKNAIEACCKHDGKRMIAVSVGNCGARVSIRIKNTCNPIYEDMDVYLSKTTKNEKDKHGFGIRSMRVSVKQYDGSIEFQYLDGCFETIVLL